jgi:hypothetical protein
MSNNLHAITIECADVGRIAHFWSEALGLRTPSKNAKRADHGRRSAQPVVRRRKLMRRRMSRIRHRLRPYYERRHEGRLEREE